MPGKGRVDGSGSIFRTKTGWVAQIRFFDEHAGRSRQIRRRAKSRDQARELLKQMLSGDSVPAPTAADITVTRWLETWQKEVLPTTNVTASTQSTYRSLIARPLKPSLGETRLKKFDEQESFRWRERLETATGRSGKPLAQSTKRQAFAVLSMALNVAVRRNLLQKNPLDAQKRPGKVRQRVPVLSPTDVDRVIAEAKGTWLQTPLVVVANTGLRIGEALALRWADIDLAAATAIISRSGVDATATKTAAGDRIVPLVPDVVAALMLQLETQTALNRQLGLGAPAADALVFTSKKGTPVDPRNSRRDLKRILVRLDLPTERPWHTFRHSLATRLLNRGVPMPVVSEIVGHASIRTTVDIYRHAEPAISAAALNEVLSKDDSGPSEVTPQR